MLNVQSVSLGHGRRIAAAFKVEQNEGVDLGLSDRVREFDATLGGGPNEVRARESQHIPLCRYGEPEEFGRAAAFLLSPAASYITPAMIPVDGVRSGRSDRALPVQRGRRRRSRSGSESRASRRGE